MSVGSPEAVALRSLAFFSDLADDDLARVTRMGRRRTFDVGESLVERGSDSGGLFVVLSGKVAVDAGGEIEELGAGESVGEMAFLDRNEQAGAGPDFFGDRAGRGAGRRSANVTAIEPVEALVIETTYFEPFLIENPTVAVAILRSVVGRLRELEARLEGGR